MVARGGNDGVSSFVADVANAALASVERHVRGGKTVGVHRLRAGSGLGCGSCCGRQALLIRSDGALIADRPGIRGVDVHLECL